MSLLDALTKVESQTQNLNQQISILTGAIQSIRDLAEQGDNTTEAGMSHNFYKIAYLCEYTMERINDLSNNPKPNA